MPEKHDRSAPDAMTQYPTQQNPSRQTPFGTLVSSLIGSLLLLAGLIAVTVAWLRDAPQAPATSIREAALDQGASPQASAGPADLSPPPSRVVATAGTPDAPAPSAATPPWTFAALVDRLAVLSARTAAFAQEDEIEAATALDREARALLEQALHHFADLGERALAMVVELPDVVEGEARLPGENTRLGVLQVLLDTELSRRHRDSEHGGHARLDALTLAVLDAMPIGRNCTELGDRALHGRPYLRMAHEPMVLHLLRLAGEGEFSREAATRLLLTLWDNLRATGARSSEELSRLALLLLDDSDVSKTVTACRQLLSDPAYRDLALAWLRERDDPALAHAVAKLAGRELPAGDALVVLRELAPQLRHTRGTFLAVGVRAPELVADAYREHLASDTYPELRRELVMGVGMLPDQRGLAVAKLALQSDPSVEVKIQAMFVHTVHGVASGAEAAVHQVLDDPRVANDPMHLAAVVLALQNLEHEDPNVIARLGARLAGMALAPKSRDLLDEILARSVPGGRR